ncbi:YqcC family protein [Pseudoalteromonas sp. MMG022]|uniref:YqcC family protein n=1 Tax=Pseudoalteromonas sp. MMG022 TaxID=2909978 RepID=UPI001F26C41A|nr:YqcC family protein [Pseudoalteromonas sp. MMG022]MCF6436361.1 YqcC family protein [Pseudoalteromonas sp. MMG022]
MNSSFHQHVMKLVQELEQILKSASLWQTQPIDPSLLQSAQPFCCDTLRFEQWLQFIFIPKMLQLLNQHADLPRNIALTPMAEVSLSTHGHVASVKHILSRLDESLSKGEIC